MGIKKYNMFTQSIIKNSSIKKRFHTGDTMYSVAAKSTFYYVGRFVWVIKMNL